MYLEFIVILFVCAVQVESEKCSTPNKEPGDCVPLPSCKILYDALQAKPETHEEFVQKSICGGTKFLPKVCCGPSSNFIKLDTRISKEDLLPSRKACGYQHSDDYFRAENDTTVRINEFPWLARIIHVEDYNESKVLIECAGSLINAKYVLTSAFCVDKDLYRLRGVRLGEFYPKNETDCVQEPPYDEECSNFEDFGIEKIIQHPNYNSSNDINDIALIRLNRTVVYTDYIRPICLPLPETVRAKVGDTLITSGWGFVKHVVTYKKRILSTLITKEECIEKLNLKIAASIRKALTVNNTCSMKHSIQSEKDCFSDYGGPVMFSHRFQWQVEAIVAFSFSCNQTEMPEVYTSLTNYLEWILETLEA